MPTIINLTIESLEVAIKSNPEVKGKTSVIHRQHAVVSPDPNSSLRSPLLILEEFSSYSGLKIIWAKSEILPIGPNPPQLQDVAFPL